MKNRIWPFGAIFSVIGVGLLMGGGMFYGSTSTFLKTAVGADGKVVDLIPRDSSRTENGRTVHSVSYYPVIEFPVNGQVVKFESSTGSNPPSYSTGERVSVLYNPVAPAQAKINSFFDLWGAALIASGLGLVFSSIGIGVIYFGIRRKQDKAWLKQFGSRIQARVLEVRLNTSYKVNGRSPWVIDCQWQDGGSGKVYVFTSDSLWFDPSAMIAKDSMIDVLVDQNQPEKRNRVQIPETLERMAA